jgi:TRAP-type transport system periplasmic protein
VKNYYLILVVIIIFSTFLTNSCTPPTQKPTPTPSATAPSPSVAEPIKLRWSHGVPPQDLFQKQVYEPWVKMIKERTTAIGKPVEITIYPAESLVKMNDTYDAILKGTIDIGSNWGPQHFRGRMPVTELFNLPFLFASSSSAGMTIQEMFETRAEIQNELREVKVLGFNPPYPYQLSSRSKPIKTLEDFKGLKLMVRGGTDSDMAIGLGAVPVPIPMPEVYMALERGTIDVGPLSWQGAYSFKWYEVTKYRTDLPIGLNTNVLIISMNMNTWNKLPPEDQKIFNELSGAYLSKMAGEASDKGQLPFIKLIKEFDAKAGNPEFYSLPNDEMLRMKKAVAPVYEKWIKDIEAKGLPGKAIFDELERVADKYNKQFPK